nr:hypothetical protein [uncultured Dysosmobacter sp.]
MKKKNCRRTDEERTTHDRATRLRKMTDAQLCDFIDSTYGRGMEEGAKLAEKQRAGTPGEEGARRFLAYLESRTGSGNRIGKGTVIYIARELENAIAAGIFREEPA